MRWAKRCAAAFLPDWLEARPALFRVSALVRAGPGFLAIELDETQPRANASMLSTRSSQVNVRLIRTNEELMIARPVCRVMGLATESGGQHA